MKSKIIIILLSLLLGGCYNDNKEITSKEVVIVNKLKITINQQEFILALEDNASVIELIKHLPMTITMEDLNKNEKYYYLDYTLPTNANAIKKIQTGDLMLYGDNCLVLFYQDFTTSYQYTRLGHIKNIDGFKEALKDNSVIISFEIIEED